MEVRDCMMASLVRVMVTSKKRKIGEVGMLLELEERMRLPACFWAMSLIEIWSVRSERTLMSSSSSRGGIAAVVTGRECWVEWELACGLRRGR